MLERFQEHLARTHLITPGARVLVGYSGGADSTCLLHLLHLAGVDLVAAHLHHGQRPEADKEQALCQAFCDDLGIPFATGRADIPRMSEDMKIGYEEAGRQARYSFFAQAMFRTECTLIATAHTQTDHVETILLNLARGSGLSGLAGIPERRDNIVRPLLPFTREQTKAYCEERGLWYHSDPANEDLSFSRARIRHRVMPELRAINPSADAAIARLSELVGEEDAFLNGMAAAALEQSEIRLNGALSFLTLDCEAAFDRVKITHLPPVLFKRAVRLAVEALGGNLDRHQTEAILTGMSDARGSVTSEKGSVAVEWDEQRIVTRQLLPTTPFRYPLTIPGETLSEEFGWAFTAFHAQTSGMPQSRTDLKVELNPAKLKGQLYFRTVNPGDEMRPLGFSGHRKISDLLSEAKLTQAARARLPLVCDLVGPLWAPGVCLDERTRLEASCETALILAFGPSAQG